MPDTTLPFTIDIDASKYTSGAVLLQQDTNGDIHPCRYLSKSVNETEWNYKIYDQELLAIIRALTEWRHYLMGSSFPVTVRSDHKNLTYFRTAQKLNRRQACWSLYLSEFDLNLIHIPGTQWCNLMHYLLRFHPIHVRFHFYFSFHKTLEQHAMNACSSIFTFFHA